jgi:hypothetical protein
MDMSGAYQSAVRAHLPGAVIVFDHFHVIKLVNDKLSELRRALYREATDVQHKEVLKGTRWLLLKNPENLDEEKDERSRLGEALRLNEPLATAYYLKDDLRRFWQQPGKRFATTFLDGWIRRAEASGIKVLQQLGRTLAAHRSGLLAYYDAMISSGPMEGTNKKIKVFQSYCLHCHSPSLGFELGCEGSPLHSSGPRAPRLAPWARSCEARRVGMGDARTPGRLETPNPALLHFVGPHGPARLGRHDLPRPDPAPAAPGGQRGDRDAQFARQLGHPDLARPQPDLAR